MVWVGDGLNVKWIEGKKTKISEFLGYRRVYPVDLASGIELEKKLISVEFLRKTQSSVLGQPATLKTEKN